jgi:oligopeptide/dipeptide ABC transporter ATP-binding protein
LSAASANGAKQLLTVEHLKLYFPVKEGLLFGRSTDRVHAVDDVSFTIDEGETLGVVGESGCGKTTLARCLIRLLDPTEGKILFHDRDITHAGRKELGPVRREMQMVFQDPQASLNPRKRVGQIVGAPLRLHGADSAEEGRRVRELLDLVGLSPEHVNRFPHEFSGGQRQRIGIARALVLHPRFVVCDEPVSALDVSIQSQVLNLLRDLQRQLALTYLFIAHNLAVVRYISDRVGVMYLGKLVEVAPTEELFDSPLHPYTQALLSAVPVADPEGREDRQRIVLVGDVPSPIDPPSGCRFHTRCPLAIDICRTVEPPMKQYGDHHTAACHVVERSRAAEPVSATPR